MTTVTLPSVCDRASARALLPELRDAIGSDPLVVDASKVERVGQAMLQLLLSAARSEAGITLREPSDALRTALQMAGLTSELGADIENGEAP